MNANELADKLSQFGEGAAFANVKLTDVATMLRQQQAEIERLTMLCECMTTECNKRGNEIEALKKQIPDWENINKPNPFIGWEKNLVAVDPNPNSGLGGVALRKAQER